MTSNVSSSVSVSSTQRDIATIERPEYEVLELTSGYAKSRRWFILWFPVGNHNTQAELAENAAYDAVARVENCDEVMLPHTKSKRIVIPLLLVNVVLKDMSVRGRCVAVKTDAELAAQSGAVVVPVPEDETDTPKALRSPDAPAPAP